MKETHPLVSIITPVYNAERYLETTIRSVLDQKYQNWEMILVDDLSTDGSRAIMEQFAEMDTRVRNVFLEKNSGSGVARNTGIAAARGRYIAFLDSDDTWHPEKLTIQIGLMETHNWDFSHTSYGYLYADGQVMPRVFHVSSHPVTYTDLLKRTEISCLTAIYNCESIGKFYMSEHRRKQDYALWLGILKSGVVSHPVDQVLAYYRQTPHSATSNKWKLILKHVSFLRETQGLGLIKAIYYTAWWMLNGVIRYYVK